ncbi:MAG: hypothetical protein CMM61_10390 [Rhodospirillaceae bacterium]|nr:hypothetical protein [Rhodospirillaceae bacterium]
MTPTATRSERLRDAGAGVTLLAFSLALWFVLIPLYAGGHGDHTTLAEIAAIVIGSLSALLILLAALGIPSASATAAEDDPFLDIGGEAEPPRLILLAAVWGLFVVGLSYVGFYISGGLAVAISFLLLGIRQPLRIALWTAGSLVISYLVFDLGFKLSLPTGRLIDALLRAGGS